MILIPTTLLAQADSCIGSKNSLNYLNYKNLLGTFYPPERVDICFSFLDTLSELDFHSGLGEIVKFNIMAGPERLTYIENKLPSLLAREYDVVKEFIVNGLSFKKNYVELDEFDMRERRLLNFAHTFGHAFEVISHYEIPHGLAVVLGMVTANYISVARGILSPDIARRIEGLCIEICTEQTPSVGDVEAIIDILKKDKKRQGAGIAAVLMSSGGRLAVVQDVTHQEVEKAVKHLTSRFIYP